MSIFAEVKLKWGEREYTIAPDDMLRCIAKVEDVITLAELHAFQQREALPYAKLAMAFAIMLQHAGAQVTEMDVYDAMFRNEPGTDRRELAMRAVRQLLVLMIPPEHLRKAPTEEEAAQVEGKSVAAAGAAA
jgi:hypothetical protein